MFKKEFFLVFALIGLGAAYVLLSLIVFITRGRWGRVFNKKLAIGATIVAFCAILNTGTLYAQTAAPTPVPTPVYGTMEPTPTPPGTLYGVPEINVFFTPNNQVIRINKDFATEIHVDTEGFRLGFFDFTFAYSESMVTLDTSVGNGGIDEGPDGYQLTMTASDPGRFTVSGAHETGYAMGNDLHLLTIYWTAGSNPGGIVLDLTINRLASDNGDQIGIPTDNDGNVVITELFFGDVNGDGVVDIIDALLTAQYYVGLNPPNFNENVADVDASGQVDIIDALLIAQKYVGLIDEFPAE